MDRESYEKQVGLTIYLDDLANQVQPTMETHGAKSDIPSDYTKKSNVFKLELHNDTEYLFQAKNKTVMEQWVQMINQISDEG